MKFLLEFVSCCGSSSSKVAAASAATSMSMSRQPAEEATLLVVQEPRRRVGRRQGRVRGGAVREWRPSLSSISEDVSTGERVRKVERRPVAAWRRCLKRKLLSAMQRDRSRSVDHHYDCRKDQISGIIPAFAPTPYMF